MAAYLQSPALPQMQMYCGSHVCSSYLNYFILYLLKKSLSVFFLFLLQFLIECPLAFEELFELYSVVTSYWYLQRNI